MEGRGGQADKSEKGARPQQLRGVEPESVLAQMALDSCEQLVAFGARERRREEFHHPQIGVHSGEGGLVGLPPFAQKETVSLQRNPIEK